MRRGLSQTLKSLKERAEEGLQFRYYLGKFYLQETPFYLKDMGFSMKKKKISRVLVTNNLRG